MAHRLHSLGSGLTELNTLELLDFVNREHDKELKDGRGRAPPAGVDRRQHPRFPCLLDTSFRPIKRDGSVVPEKGYLKCKAINISEGGLLLEGDVHIPQGQRLEIYVKLEGNLKTIAGEAEAIRMEENCGRFRIGVKFINKEII